MGDSSSSSQADGQTWTYARQRAVQHAPPTSTGFSTVVPCVRIQCYGDLSSVFGSDGAETACLRSCTWHCLECWPAAAARSSPRWQLQRRSWLCLGRTLPRQRCLIPLTLCTSSNCCLTRRYPESAQAYTLSSGLLSFDQSIILRLSQRCLAPCPACICYCT